MPTCPSCLGTVIEYDSAAGNSFCITCGTVIEENAIVSEITFGESSSGAAVANGTFVAAGSTRARMSGKHAGQGMESREQVIENGRRRINEVAFAMKLSETISQAAQRYFNLCITSNFIKGRRSQHVAATCLYVSCRMKKTSHMLIDFSDRLRINVFTLGSTYTKMIRILNIKLPLIDPVHYVGRFAAMLEFGDETAQVATDAIRLIQRYDRDWLQTGRRPSGICGACLLLAARMNNFRRSIQEIVQVVKIADTTVKKRLDEFKKTPSGALTVSDFRSLWLEEEADPPAFTRGKEKRLKMETEGENTDEDGDADDESGSDGEESRRPHKRRRTATPSTTVNPTQEENDGGQSLDSAAMGSNTGPHASVDMNEGILRYAQTRPNDGEPEEEPDESFQFDEENGVIGARDHAENEKDDAVMTEELERLVQSGEAILSGMTAVSTGSEPASTLPVGEDGLADKGDDVDEEAVGDDPQPTVEDLGDIDDEEMSAYICTQEEVVRKTRLWVEFNRDYLEAIAAKGVDQESGTAAPRQRKKRKPTKPRDETNPMGSTPAEATKSMIKTKKSKFSKRINYDAIGALLTDSAKKNTSKSRLRASASADEKSDGEKSDGLSALQTMVADDDDDIGPRGVRAGMDDGEDDYYDNFEAEGYQEEV